METINKTIANLKSHAFAAEYLADRNAARERILALTKPGASVGLGGSSTVRDTGIVKALEDRGHKIFDHWKHGLNPAEILNIRKAHLTCDVFLTGANAIAQTGQIMNREGVGNRTNAMTFGPGKVIIVAGKNKITPNVDAAMERIRAIAAPKRNMEYNTGNPCIKAGRCVECNSPMRICRITTILERRPMLTDITVLIVGEDMGN